MSAPRLWTRKPVLGVGINANSSLATGLRICCVFNEGGGQYGFNSRLMPTAIFGDNRNAFSLKNGATWAASDTGPCLSFDGSNDYAELINGGSLTPIFVSRCSLFIRFNTTSTSTFGQLFRVSPTNVGGLNNKVDLYTTNTGFVRIDVYSNAGSPVTLDTGTYTTNVWNDYCWTHDNSDLDRVYFNGRAITPAGPAARDGDGGTYNIGGFAGPSNLLPGKIDLCYAWDRPLTVAEAFLLHQNPFALFAPLPDLRALQAIQASLSQITANDFIHVLDPRCGDVIAF